MKRADFIQRAAILALWAGTLSTGFPTVAMGAGSYSQLQVLLPGETESPGTSAGKVGTPDPQAAGIPFDVRVRACDDEWFTVTTVTNVVQMGASDVGATLPPSQALIAGELTVSVTLNAGGSFTVTAQDETDPSIPEAVSAAVTVMVLQGFEFSRINQKNQHAGVPMSITVYAVDPTGNVVVGYSGAVKLKEITSFGDGRISPDEVTLTQGVWSGEVTNYRADETSINRGNVNIQAYLEPDPATNGLSDPFVVHPGPFERVQIVVPGQTPLPGSLGGVTGTPASQAAGQTFSVEIYGTDAYWNPVPSSDVVRVTSSDPAANTPVSGALTNGYVQFSVSLGTVGSQTLTVIDQTNGSIQGMTTPDINVVPAGAHHFVIDPIPSPIVAGNAVSVTIRATDASGNTIPDYSGNAFLSANTGPGSISPDQIIFSNGVWADDVTFRGAGGAVSLTCSDFAAPPHIGSSNSFEVLPGPYTGLQVLLPGQSPQGGTAAGYSGSPSDQNAGTTFTVTARAVDAYWNRVPAISNRITLTSSDAFADLPAETTLVNGEILIPATLFRAGWQTISAADLDSTGVQAHTSSMVEVLAGTYSRILLLLPGEELVPGTQDGRTGAATDQSINFAFTAAVYATDAWWNPIAGVTDVIGITSSDPLATLPPDTPLVDGQIELPIRLATGGFQQLTAWNLTQPSIPASTTQVRAISSGFHLEADVTPTQVQAGEPFILTVRVTNDAGSVIQEINSLVTVEVQNANTQEPGQGTLHTTQFQLIQGERSVSETYTFAEPIVLVIRDDAGNDPAVTEVIVIDPGDPATIDLSSDPSWVGGNKNATVSAAVVDEFGNGVPAQPVDFVLLVGQGTLTPIDTETADNGVATADFLSSREAGMSRIRSTSNQLVAELDIETSLVDPNMPGGTVTNYPNPFHPGEVPTTIAYKLSDDANVTLRIFTLNGELVLRHEFSSGTPGGTNGLNEFRWDGRNGKGRVVASGAYILTIDATGAGETLHVMRRKVGVVR